MATRSMSQSMSNTTTLLASEANTKWLERHATLRAVRLVTAREGLTSSLMSDRRERLFSQYNWHLRIDADKLLHSSSCSCRMKTKSLRANSRIKSARLYSATYFVLMEGSHEVWKEVWIFVEEYAWQWRHTLVQVDQYAVCARLPCWAYLPATKEVSWGTWIFQHNHQNFLHNLRRKENGLCHDDLGLTGLSDSSTILTLGKANLSVGTRRSWDQGNLFLCEDDGYDANGDASVIIFRMIFKDRGIFFFRWKTTSVNLAKLLLNLHTYLRISHTYILHFLN